MKVLTRLSKLEEMIEKNTKPVKEPPQLSREERKKRLRAVIVELGKDHPKIKPYFPDIEADFPDIMQGIVTFGSK